MASEFEEEVDEVMNVALAVEMADPVGCMIVQSLVSLLMAFILSLIAAVRAAACK